jgi:Tfp pilus assembly protein PilZ
LTEEPFLIDRRIACGFQETDMTIPPTGRKIEKGIAAGSINEKRSEPRVYYELPAVVEKPDHKDAHQATIQNYDNSGLYFKTDLLLEVGEDVTIGIASVPDDISGDSGERFRIKILWVETLSDSPGLYGYGARTVPTAAEKRVRKTDDDMSELRKHPRKKYYKWVFFVSEGKHCKGLMHNISRGGLFIRTRENLSKRQQIRLVIPGTLIDQGTMLRGEVVHTNPEGVGVKFTGVVKSGRRSNAH